MVFAGGMYRKPFMSHERGTVVIDKLHITSPANRLEDTTESIIAHELTHLRFDKLTNAGKYFPSAKDFPPRQDKAKALQNYIDAYSAKRIEEEVYAFRAGFRNAQNNHPTRAIPCEDKLYEAYGRSFSGRLTPEMIKKVGQILLDSRGYKQDYADAATKLYNMHWDRK